MSTKSDFGSYAWGLETKGVVSFREKINYLLSGAATKVALLWRKHKNPIKPDLEAVKLPDSALVWSAYAYAKELHEMPVVHHALRAYLLGVVFAEQEGLAYDQELFALSALLHNIGLEEAYCRPSLGFQCFAIEGAHMAGKWLQQQGLAEGKAAVVQEAIARHINVSVSSQRPEAYLLQKASGTDAIGIAKKELAQEVIHQALERYPLLDGIATTNALLQREVEKRPQSRMALLYQLGFEKRLVNNYT